MTELIKSLIQFQSEVGIVQKNKTNPFHHNKYADLAMFISVATPILTKNGLCISQTCRVENNTTILITTLWHISGVSIVSEYVLRETVTKKEQTKDEVHKISTEFDPQSLASSMTYARRYCYAAILGITADDDDDGNYASGLHNQQQKQSYPSNGNGNGKPKERERCPKCNEPKLIRDKFEPEKKYCLDCSVKFDSNMKEIIKEPVHHSEQTTFLEDETPEHNPDPTEKYPF